MTEKKVSIELKDKQVKMISDGTPQGTKIELDGKLVNVKSAVLSLDAAESFGILRLVMITGLE